MARAADLASDVGRTGRSYGDMDLISAANASGKSLKNLGSKSMNEEVKDGHSLKRVNYNHEQ